MGGRPRSKRARSSRFWGLYSTALPNHTMLVTIAASLALHSVVFSPSPQGSETAKPSAAERAVTVEKSFLLGPAAATKLGLTVAWQIGVPVASGASLVKVVPLGDSVITLSSDKVISRFRTETGDELWQRMSSNSIDEIHGINLLRADGRDDVLLSTDTDIIVLDGGTGAPRNEQSITAFPSCASVLYGPFLIFGSKTGILQWQQVHVGVPWHKNKLRGEIRASPQLNGTRVVAASLGGTVMMLDAATAEELWTRRLAGGVRGEIAFDGRSVWLASDDQYVYAMNAISGKTEWRYFTEAPIRSSVSLLGDALLVDLPDEGLVCFEAHPEGLSAVVRWKRPGFHSLAIAKVGNTFLTWDSQTHELTALDAVTGTEVVRAALPAVADVRSSVAVDGDLYLICADGCLERLRPAAAKSILGTKSSTDSEKDQKVVGSRGQ